MINLGKVVRKADTKKSPGPCDCILHPHRLPQSQRRSRGNIYRRNSMWKSQTAHHPHRCSRSHRQNGRNIYRRNRPWKAQTAHHPHHRSGSDRPNHGKIYRRNNSQLPRYAPVPNTESPEYTPLMICREDHKERSEESTVRIPTSSESWVNQAPLPYPHNPIRQRSTPPRPPTLRDYNWVHSGGCVVIMLISG